MSPDLFLPTTRPLREARHGILSALAPQDEGAMYDARAAVYDAVVGNLLYNRLIWSASTDRYRDFARRALASATGPLLDAGCGSAVFTAQAYAETKRPVVLVDRSVGMLEAARKRIRSLIGGQIPPTVQFLQADLLDLPFAPGHFDTVLSMGMLHLFDAVEPTVRSLSRMRAPGGGLFLTGLVAEKPVGRRYLSLLHRAGEVASPARFTDVREAVEAGTGSPVEATRDGSMGFYIAPAR